MRIIRRGCELQETDRMNLLSKLTEGLRFPADIADKRKRQKKMVEKTVNDEGLSK